MSSPLFWIWHHTRKTLLSIQNSHAPGAARHDTGEPESATATAAAAAAAQQHGAGEPSVMCGTLDIFGYWETWETVLEKTKNHTWQVRKSEGLIDDDVIKSMTSMMITAITLIF